MTDAYSEDVLNFLEQLIGLAEKQNESLARIEEKLNDLEGTLIGLDR